MQIIDLLKIAVSSGASDLHLTEDMPPIFRIDGQITLMDDVDSLSKGHLKEMLYKILSPAQIERFESDLELDMSLNLPDSNRVRANIHKQRGSVEAAFRIILYSVNSLENLGLPKIVSEFARKPNGLVLVTGHAGVGKSTTLAAMIDLINTERRAVIITIEEPIEYIFKNKNSIVKQREVGTDTKSFSNALRHALRQDPDVIMIGEMRDLETISIALTAAETGHLILSMLHTPDAMQTIDRILDVFPAGRQDEIKTQLADCLQGIVCQQLLPMADRKGRVPAVEIMIATPAIRNLIRHHQTEQLLSLMQTGAEYGMKPMDKSLKELLDAKRITYETAISRARNIKEFQRPYA
jgi:twitching motility protein PilT